MKTEIGLCALADEGDRNRTTSRPNAPPGLV